MDQTPICTKSQDLFGREVVFSAKRIHFKEFNHVWTQLFVFTLHVFKPPVVLGSNLTHFQKVFIPEMWVSFNQIVKINNVDGSIKHSSCVKYMISSLLSLNLGVLFNFIAFGKKQQKSTKTSKKVTKKKLEKKVTKTLGIATKEFNLKF